MLHRIVPFFTNLSPPATPLTFRRLLSHQRQQTKFLLQQRHNSTQATAAATAAATAGGASSGKHFTALERFPNEYTDWTESQKSVREAIAKILDKYTDEYWLKIDRTGEFPAQRSFTFV